MITYQDSNTDIKTVYTVEYIDNKKDAEYVASGRIDNGEPRERYKKKTFDEIDKAFSIYMVMLVREDIYDVRFFEDAYLNGDIVREQYVEGVPTLQWAIRNAVNRKIEKYNERLLEDNKVLSSSVDAYEAFIKKYNALETFKKFTRELEEVS